MTRASEKERVTERGMEGGEGERENCPPVPIPVMRQDARLLREIDKNGDGNIDR